MNDDAEVIEGTLETIRDQLLNAGYTEQEVSDLVDLPLGKGNPLGDGRYPHTWRCKSSFEDCVQTAPGEAKQCKVKTCIIVYSDDTEETVTTGGCGG